MTYQNQIEKKRYMWQCNVKSYKS